MQLTFATTGLRCAQAEVCKEAAMRAEAEKLAESIRDSLALLRRHL